MLTQDIEKYINELVESYQQIESIWLFGSRANGREHKNSDWDFFVFGTPEVLQLLKDDNRFHQSFLDLLIIYDGDNFEDHKGEGKNGSLTEWGWKKENERHATYTESKSSYSESGENLFYRKTTICNAILIYPVS